MQGTSLFALSNLCVSGVGGNGVAMLLSYWRRGRSCQVFVHVHGCVGVSGERLEGMDIGTDEQEKQREAGG